MALVFLETVCSVSEKKKQEYRSLHSFGSASMAGGGNLSKLQRVYGKIQHKSKPSQNSLSSELTQENVKVDSITAFLILLLHYKEMFTLC